jgi:hypothetical protein
MLKVGPRFRQIVEALQRPRAHSPLIEWATGSDGCFWKPHAGSMVSCTIARLETFSSSSVVRRSTLVPASPIQHHPCLPATCCVLGSGPLSTKEVGICRSMVAVILSVVAFRLTIRRLLLSLWLLLVVLLKLKSWSSAREWVDLSWKA